MSACVASDVHIQKEIQLRDSGCEAQRAEEGPSRDLLPYIDLELNAEAAWRIKPATTFTLSEGSHPKYLSRVGDIPIAYLPHTTTLEMLSDPKVNLVITEGEFKTLSIAEALQKAKQKGKFAVLGLQGVNGGWHREKKVVPTADGGHEK